MKPIQRTNHAEHSLYQITAPKRSIVKALPPVYIRKNTSHVYECVFRAFDILFSLMLIAILLFFLPFICLANLALDPGPLFYTQRRVGRNGHIFTMYKLRSMVVNAEAGGARFTCTGDTRITRVGSFLRKTRLDELPQAINVLKGDMAIIGPRPERPEFVQILAQKDPSYDCRHLVRPGITGWAQVKYKYTDNIEDGLIKLSYDLYYISHRSIKIDTQILALTILLVAGQKGT
jgi:lipopolysaccharide/colanic/teichoic acid biosynthesis glycosyltransferase